MSLLLTDTNKEEGFIHLIGVGGSGMSGIAHLLLDQGYQVSGSDIRTSSMIDALKRRGLRFFLGQEKDNVKDASLVIYSSAVTKTNVERAHAQDLGVRQILRADALAHISRERKNIIVCGMHGKTTVAAMLSYVLSEANMKPGYYIGAEINQGKQNACWGGSGPMIIEADESDGTLVQYKPSYSMLLNIECEHLDFYDGIEHIRETFKKVIDQTLHKIVCCIDCSEVKELIASSERFITYGFSDEAMYRAQEIEEKENGSRFTILRCDETLGQIELQVPGKHNVVNALGVVTMALELGVGFLSIKQALEKFVAVKRRFQKIYQTDSYLIVDDYAHHPTEIEATLQAAKSYSPKRIVGVFQPHRFTRTQRLAQRFSECFQGVDLLILTDIYASSEEPLEGVNALALAQLIQEKSGCEVLYAKTLQGVISLVRNSLQDGDLVLTMGAGDVYKVSHEIGHDLELFDQIQKKFNDAGKLKLYEPMRKHTTLRVGGAAKYWFEPSSEEALAKMLVFCNELSIEYMIIGRGSNLLIRDGGINGMCIHLSASEFKKISMDQDKIYAGAGARLKEIVIQAKKNDLGGIEFMEGIPGNLGGGLRMNAGAMSSEIYDVVESLRVMDMNGEIHILQREEIDVRYRSVPMLRNLVVLSAVIKVIPRSSEDIKLNLIEYSKKRWSSQPAAASAGCTFKNCVEISTGKLIDELGLKNLSVGNARVSEVHGNFIVNDGDASASDILELIEKVKNIVKVERSLDLVEEVIIVGKDIEEK